MQPVIESCTMLLWIAALTLLASIAIYLTERANFSRFRQYANFPQLRSSLLWGHLKALDGVMREGDRRRHIDQVFLEIKQKLNNPPVFIADFRPFLHVICVICDHEVAEQISRSSKTFPYSVPKGNAADIFKPLMGAKSIILAEGTEWKGLRKRFNPGFAPQHLISLLPCILDRVGQFIDILDGYAASGEVFGLGELCTNLTFDVIGAVSMDEDFRAQREQASQSEIVVLFRDFVATWRTGGSAAWDVFKVRTQARRWWLSRRLNRVLRREVQRKYAEWKAHGAQKQDRSVLALSFEAVESLDGHVLDQTCDQIKTFLFAGHDTTSSLLQWAFYELSRTPHALRAARQELGDIFGPDSSPDSVRVQLLTGQSENLLSRMPYISAIVKETLRLHPPAGTARHVPYGSGFNVQLPDGETVCLDGMVLHNCATIIQRDERVYGPTKETFVPERWLDQQPNGAETEANSLPTSAWRPFERGPRNCIGQELAIIEARVVLACTLRRYDFTKVGLGEIQVNDKGQAIMGEDGQYNVQSELFNIWEVIGKPVDGTQMRVAITGADIQ